MTAVKRASLLSRFTCLGDRCEDTCCQGWSMQVDPATRERYQREAPALLEAVEAAEETPWIMRKNPDGFCVKLESGLCGIHKSHGETFLGDACYFYPRVTRALGDAVVMTAAPSCPEIARLALFEDAPFAYEDHDQERLPQTLKHYLPEGMTAGDALAVHQAFLAAAEDMDVDAEKVFLRIASASRSLERGEVATWPYMAAFYLQHADEMVPEAEQQLADPFNLLHALCGLIAASRKAPSPRLSRTIADMESALEAALNAEKTQIHTDERSLPAYERLKHLWRNEAQAAIAPILRRWLRMQLSLCLYPFSGPGNALSERATLLGLRLAILRLALLCAHGVYGGALPQDVVIRVVQSVSRFLDHLGDPGLSLQLCAETGWNREGRMRGLLTL